MINLKNAAILLALEITCFVSLNAQQPMPTSGDVTVRLNEPIDFATARPLQAVRATVVSSTNPAIPPGSFAVLQVQNRDGSYTLKLLRLKVGGQILKMMSQAGVSVSGPPASGAHASLANGAVVKFTLTEQDGSQGAAPNVQASTQSAKPAQSGATKGSKSPWTAYPNQGGVVPDAVLIGEVPLMNGTDERREVGLQLGCDDRNGTKQSVFRFLLPHSIKFDLSALGNTPTTLRSKNKAVMQFDLFSGTTDRLFLGNRMMYFAKESQGNDLVQYDADTRELGSFASPENVGKTAHFNVGDVDARDLQFKIPPVDAAITAVLAACNATPYSGTDELSSKYADALVSATEAIASFTSITDTKPDSLPALEGIVITNAEWNAYRELGDFYDVSLAENVKSKGHVAAPRRKKCADALVAEFKAGSYKAAPVACAYVAKEAPE